MAELSTALNKHPNRSFVAYLIYGLINGFMAGLSYLPSVSYVCQNLRSALDEPDVVDRLLAREVERGYMIGPYDDPIFPVFRINPIGVATRKYSGKKRLIMDLSSPHHGSVPSINSLIPLTPFSLSYATVDHAITLIKLAGRGAWLGKADITDAFKIIPLHKSQWHLFGVRWRGKSYFSVRLPFGSRSSPAIFNHLSEALCWILLNNLRLPFVLHLLDDFLVVDYPASSPARCINALTDTFNSLGVPLSPEKTQGPSQVMEFLGITLDSLRMRASLPLEKLVRIREVMHSMSAATSLTKRELLSLLGHLNFAMRVIPQGRSFISRLLDLSKSVAGLSDSVVLDEGCRSDLGFWASLLEGWNGISMFLNDQVESSAELKFYTDAAPSLGYGGIFGDQWFAGGWPVELSALPPSVQSTALMEIYPIAVACVLWGHLWSRKRIVVFCDNEAAVHIINKGRSNVPLINSFVRRITWSSVRGSFMVRAAHIPGLDNTVADSLSRFNFQVFRRLCPQAAAQGLHCPAFSQMVLD